MTIYNITKEKVEEVLKRQGFFTVHRYKYSHQKARSHMKQLVKEGIAVYDRSNARKEEVSISLAKMRKIVCRNGDWTATYDDFPFEVYRKLAKIKNWQLDFDCFDEVKGFITPNGKIHIHNIPRDDTNLVKVVEITNPISHRIVEIPSNAKWEIRTDEFNYEWVVEKHREWC